MVKTNWNLKSLYNNVDDAQIDVDVQASIEANKVFVSKWKEDDRYLVDDKILLEALTEYEELEKNYGACNRPSYYFHLLSCLDQTDTEVKARLNKINDIAIKLENDIQFFELSLSKISENQQKIFLASPLLENYRHFLESLFAVSKYLLSDNEEKVFNVTSKTSYSNWVDMLSELLDKQVVTVKTENGNLEEISYNEIGKFLDSKVKKVRDYASIQFNKINEKYLEIAEFELNSVLEGKKVSDEYRGIERPDLTRHLGDDIDTEIVETLVEVVSNNFDISQKYYKYKAEMLGLKNIRYYERNVPLGDINLQYSWEDSFKLVEDTFKKLDQQFYGIIKGFEDNGQYDVFPKSGKSGGGFCITGSHTLPSFILLNHTNKLNDVLTIAHESGHGIHAEMSKCQSALNSGHPISLAEVASTFFEDFVLENILENTDRDKKKVILNQKANNDISTIFRQVAFYNFERELHSEFRKKGYLKKEYICDLFCKHMKSYLGNSVLEDDSMRYGWIYVSHFRNFFYVYSYASGLLISKVLQSMVRSDIKKIELVKKFLSSGSTKSPKNLFKEIGIDITKKEFWENGIAELKSSMVN